MKTFTVLVAVLLLVFSMGCKPKNEPTPVKVSTETFAPLSGRWVRLDGGYILMVHRIDPDGKVNAGYFNPNPIRVSQAQASVEGGVLKLFVELNDEGYPGCTYKLTYDKAKNQLAGVYFQAAMQQSYEIVFERTP
jgi:hypothetical protein